MTTEINQISEDFKEKKDPCLKGLDKINKGIYCVLASGKGSEFASVNGTDVTIKVKEDTAETETSSCKKMFNAVCLAANGEAPENDIQIDDTEVTSDNQKLKKGCGNLKEKGAKFLEDFNPANMKNSMPNKEKLADKAAKIKLKKD